MPIKIIKNNKGVFHYEGTDITVSEVIDLLANGDTPRSISRLESYKSLTPVDILNGLKIASENLDKRTNLINIPSPINLINIPNTIDRVVDFLVQDLNDPIKQKAEKVIKPIINWSYYIAIITFLVALFFIGLYFYKFALVLNWRELSENQGVWGTFGDYLGGTLNPLLSLANLIAIFILGFLIFKLETNRNESDKDNQEESQRMANTFKIIEEWDSESMRRSRNIAWEKFHKDPTAKFLKLPFSSYSAEERFDLNRVLEFFERLNLLSKHKMVKKRIIKDYFKRDYTKWDECFKEQIEKETDEEFKHGFEKVQADGWLEQNSP